jgi:isoamylase
VTLPDVPGGRGWRCALDTRQKDGAGEERMHLAGRPTLVDGRSVLIFTLVEQPGL